MIHYRINGASLYLSRPPLSHPQCIRLQPLGTWIPSCHQSSRRLQPRLCCSNCSVFCPALGFVSSHPCTNCSFSLPGFSARLQPPVPLHQLRLLLVLLLRPPPAIRLLLQPQLLLARRGSGHRRHPACRGPHAFVHGHCPRLRSGHRRHPARGHRFSARLQPPVTAPIAVSPCPAVVQLSGLCCSIRGVFVRCLALLAQPLAVPPMRNCALFSTCPLLDYCFNPR